MYVILEYWGDDIAEEQFELGRGISSHPKQDIEDIMNKYNAKFVRTIHDQDDNLVYTVNHQ